MQQPMTARRKEEFIFNNHKYAITVVTLQTKIHHNACTTACTTPAEYKDNSLKENCYYD